ncbi:paraquat-inducible protein A [Hasllibacter halocynthiae]|nr:paraquat-inducible protein A [Hasllibacter halocynthiae]
MPAPPDPRGLVVCPRCDALHHAPSLKAGGRADCARCGTVLEAPRRISVAEVLALSATVGVLMLGALFLPFLSISSMGLRNDSSIIDAALAFSTGLQTPLVLTVLASIVLLPLARVALLWWAMAPLAFGGAPLPGARAALALDEDLKPWAMAEIFVVGVAVALVKIADLASLTIGPAFWMLICAVLVGTLQEALTDRSALWRELEVARTRARASA